MSVENREDRYSGYLFEPQLNELAGLQRYIRLQLTGVDSNFLVPVSLVGIQSLHMRDDQKIYCAAYNMIELLKHPALFYPEETTSWYQDLWFHYTLLSSTSELKAYVVFIVEHLPKPIKDDDQLSLIIALWHLLQILNPNEYPNSDKYLETLYGSDYTWGTLWWKASEDIYYLGVTYYVNSTAFERNKWTTRAPHVSLFLQTLQKPEPLSFNRCEMAIYEHLADYQGLEHRLGQKKKLLQFILEKSHAHSLTLEPDVLRASFEFYKPITLLSAMIPDLIWCQANPVSKDDDFNDLTPMDKAAFVFDAISEPMTLSNKPLTEGYAYVLTLHQDSVFQYTLKNNFQFTLHCHNPLILRAAYLDAVQKIVKRRIAYIDRELSLVRPYLEIEKNRHLFINTAYEIRQNILRNQKLLQLRFEAIKYHQVDETHCQSYIKYNADTDIPKKIETLKLSYEKILADAKYADLRLPKGCKLRNEISWTFGAYDKHLNNLDTEVDDIDQLWKQCKEGDAILIDLESAQRAKLERFSLAHYVIHLALPYRSLLALLGALGVISLSLGVLLGNPACAFLTLPFLAQYTSILSTIGLVVGSFIALPCACQMARYGLYRWNANADRSSTSPGVRHNTGVLCNL